MLGSRVVAVKRLRGGRNSRVCRLVLGGGERYLAKLYFRHDSDNRDRLQVEFTSLQFLWDHGVRCVPRPVAVDKAKNCAVYEYVDGRHISSHEVSSADIDLAVEFLTRLGELTSSKASLRIPLASDACLSVQSVLDNIQKRLQRLSELPYTGAPYEILSEFLRCDFIPATHEIVARCQTRLDQLGTSLLTELPVGERTLSPSDFGFHNALRRGDSRIVFLDFEYFGWDDPAKMIADFLLHPAMDLASELKERFVSNIMYQFANNQSLAERLRIVYPLYGLHWCMIFLNEFIPEQLERRQFARGMGLEVSELRIRQLSKARQMLHNMTSDNYIFPYDF